jgi:hypothetical protein
MTDQATNTHDASGSPLERPGRPVSGALTSGHYFKFERGQWTKDGNWAPSFYQASGRTDIGCLTLEQRIELDALIDKYLKSIEA